MIATLPPVIAIDGPSASGKGTVARAVAQRLGFNFLDSGALYRLVALAALSRGMPLDSEGPVEEVARALAAAFVGDRVMLDGRDVGTAMRAEEVGVAASRVAALPGVRAALLERQRAFRQAPGLVADGRDMGTVVFPDASLKIFLTADARERARRRYKQLIEKGLSASMDALLQEILDRDARDSQRAAAPLQKSADAVGIDTTGMPVEAVVAAILKEYERANRAP